MKKSAKNWNVYCSRFLIKAKQLTCPFTFVDVRGNEYRGAAGDYLVESVDGGVRILKKRFMEDIYMLMGPAKDRWQAATEKEKDKTTRSQSRFPPRGEIYANSQSARGKFVQNAPARRPSRVLIA